MARSAIWPSGICSVCGVRRQVRGDGFIRSHVVPGMSARSKLTCGGSGRPPVRSKGQADA